MAQQNINLPGIAENYLLFAESGEAMLDVRVVNINGDALTLADEENNLFETTVTSFQNWCNNGQVIEVC